MLKQVLKKIKPSKKEESAVNNIVSSFLLILNKNLKNSEAVVGGSFAKGTWLSKQHDIDIFVLFNDDQNCSNILESAIKKSFKTYTRIHGSRDYFSLKFKNLHFELVPVFKIENPIHARNITDISHLHVSYIKENTTEKLRDDIRLAKYFLKCNSCYGAETFIGGFSGYVTELLVIYYGGFDNFIKNVSKWKKGLVIDIDKNNNFNSNQIFSLVVIDPVQPDRNASAGLKEDKLISFIEICKAYSKKPSVSFFKVKKIDLKKYDLILKIDPLSGFTDVVGTKMLKVFEYVKTELNMNGFEVLDSGWFWEKQGVLYYKLKNKKLSRTFRHYGPPLDFKENIEAFKKKYNKYEVCDDKFRVYVDLDRKFNDYKSLINYLIKTDFVKSRVKRIRL